MKPWMRSIALVLFVGLAVHFGVVTTLPTVIMKVVLSRVSKRKAVNAATHAPAVSAKSRQVVMPSPDLLYTVCAFDLSTKTSLTITAQVPSTYWSLAVYDDSTNNVYVTNDKKVGPGLHTWKLQHSEKGNGGSKSPSKGKLIQSPSKKGLILIRMLIHDRTKLKQLQAIQKKTRCKAD